MALHQLVRPQNLWDSVVQRFNLKPPEGHLLAEKNQDWWNEQEFSAHLAGQKAKIDQKLAELSHIQPWSDEMVYLMQIPGFGLLTSLILLAAVGDIARFSHPTSSR